VDDEARLRVRRAEAELAEHRAGIIRAQARVRVEAARAEELRGELERRRGLVAAGGVSTGEIANIGLKLATQEHELEVAQAEVAQADAAAERVGVLRDEAALALDRMEVRSPAAGVVLNRLVGPGSRLSMAGSNAGAGSDAMSGAVLRLYDPAKLQVRVDIPLAEAAKVGVGAVAAIVTEAMPGRSFSGRVTRVVHEANIQRNTVQVKVAIDDSDPILKPEMLTRVRFMAAADSAHTGTATPGWADAQGTAGMWAPTSGLTATGDGVARAWVIDHRGGAAGTVAEGREVRVLGEAEGGYTPVGPVEGDGSRGLRPGDRVIIDAPAGLKAGTRVDVSEDDSTGGPAAEGE
jgi:hypothetical protein